MTEATDRAGTARADAARLSPPDHSLIEGHLKLAGRLAGQYRGRGLDDDELAAVANLALCEAAGRYDLAYCRESFARFAELKIRAALWDALCAAPIVRAGRAGERARLRGDAPGWTPYAVSIEHLGAMAREAPDEDLAGALAGCTEAEQDVIRLSVIEGFGVGQVALKLGMGRDAVRAAKASGLKRMAASLAERN